ncbi:MAG: hypothetical protein JJ900_14805 [Rhodospirillales bacterium]|nr:hypothetical protein [Rhodospirillales bacterium]MBO6788115.1 hypothetical protein [Rhodospirillales bacterium]
MSEEDGGKIMGDESESDESKPETTAHAPFDVSIVRDIVKALESRSARLKRGATLALSMIVVLLIGGSYAIWNIEALLNDEPNTLDTTTLDQSLGEINRNLEALNAVVAEAGIQASEVNGWLDASKTPSFKIDGELARLDALQGEVGKFVAEKKGLEVRLSQLQSEQKAAKDRLFATSRLLPENKSVTSINQELADLALDQRKFEVALERARRLLASATSQPQAPSDAGSASPERDVGYLRSEIERLTNTLQDNKNEQKRIADALDFFRANERNAQDTLADYEQITALLDNQQANLRTQREVADALTLQFDAWVNEHRNLRQRVGTIVAQSEEVFESSRSLRDNLATRTVAMQTTLENAEAAFKEKQDSETLSSLGTRAALIVLLLFLVQILVTLYRYNMRLASFYDARIDALKLAGSTNVKVLGELVSHLSPEQLDFGKTPATVTEQAFEFAKEMLNRQSARGGR